MAIRKKKMRWRFYFRVIINHKIMSVAILRQVGLLLHIIGLTMTAGVTLVSYIASRKFLAQYRQDKEKGFAILHTVSRLPRVAAIGLLILIFSGVLMISASGG